MIYYMGRMSLEDRIKILERVIETTSMFGRDEGMEQIVEWLKELKVYKDRQEVINKSWQELINYKEGIEKIKMRSQSYRERGEAILASGMEQALDILEEVQNDNK